MQTAGGYITTRCKGITVSVVMGLPFDNEDGNIRGAWEVYSTEDKGISVYGEGIIRANSEKEVYDYDGAFSLPSEVCTLLREIGFKTEEVE